MGRGAIDTDRQARIGPMCSASDGGTRNTRTSTAGPPRPSARCHGPRSLDGGRRRRGLHCRAGPPRPSNLPARPDQRRRLQEGAFWSALLPVSVRIEGFGRLPAVEAMASGCPVVASTSPCLPEVCGEAALYADPDDIYAWAEAVRRLMGSPGLRKQLAAAGQERARILYLARHC